MKATIIRSGLALFLLVGSGGPCTGQFSSGDLVVFPGRWQTSPVLGIRPAGSVYTVRANLPFAVRSAVPLGWANQIVVAGGAVALLTDQAQIWYSRSPQSGVLVDVDWEGPEEILTLDSPQGASILKVHYGSFQLYTIHATTVLARAFAAASDLQSGDLVVAGMDAGNRPGLSRISLGPSPRTSTLVSLPGWDLSRGASFHREPGGASLLFFARSAVHRLTLRPSPVVSTLHVGYPLQSVIGSVDRDTTSGRFFVPTSDPASRSGAVLTFDAATGRFATMASFQGYEPAAVALAGSRHLNGGVGAWPWHPPSWSLVVHAARDAGAPYVVAFSLSTSPPVPTGGGRAIHLARDALFNWSLTGSIYFLNFQGRLDAGGFGWASFWYPRGTPSLHGLRVFAAAVTIANQGISTISETVGFTLPTWW